MLLKVKLKFQNNQLDSPCYKELAPNSLSIDLPNAFLFEDIRSRIHIFKIERGPNEMSESISWSSERGRESMVVI